MTKHLAKEIKALEMCGFRCSIEQNRKIKEILVKHGVKPYFAKFFYIENFTAKNVTNCFFDEAVNIGKLEAKQNIIYLLSK